MERLNAVVASRNEHKARELERLLPGWQIDPLDAAEFPPEEGETYYENALGKARFGRTVSLCDSWVLGEDSGLEVEGLGGGPGVRSSRSAAGDEVGWLLRELAGVEGDGRRARYVCELVGISPDAREFRGSGVLEGRIALEAQGSEGFGFDPVFIPEGEEQTVARLGNEWKAHHSHRARAARQLLDALRQAG